MTRVFLRPVVLFSLLVVLVVAVGFGSTLTPAAAQGTEHRIQGTVRDAAGEPLAGIPIGLRGHGASEGQNREGATASDGTFSFDAPDGAYNLLVATTLGSECTVAGYDNPASGWMLNIAVKGEDISGLGVTVSGPSSTAQCFSGAPSLQRPSATSRARLQTPMGNRSKGSGSRPMSTGTRGVYEGEWTASDGTFHLRLRHGVYWLHVQSDRSNECTVSGQEDAGGPGGAIFDTRDGDVADLRITVSGPDSASPVWAVCDFDAPFLWIEGTVLGSDGEPVAGIAVRAYGEPEEPSYGPGLLRRAIRMAHSQSRSRPAPTCSGSFWNSVGANAGLASPASKAGIHSASRSTSGSLSMAQPSPAST